jgi:predicted adenylyl cyclase CyaB
MPRNIEIKARVGDLAALRARVALLPIRGTETLDQTDTFFEVARGRLKLRELADGTGELIFYERPDEPDAKLCRYERLPCSDPSAARRMLASALGVRGTVRKHREVFLVGRTRIHLDAVEGLGSFLELEVVLEASESLEAGRAVAADLMRALEVEPASLVRGAYIDLLRSA